MVSEKENQIYTSKNGFWDTCMNIKLSILNTTSFAESIGDISLAGWPFCSLDNYFRSQKKFVYLKIWKVRLFEKIKLIKWFKKFCLLNGYKVSKKSDIYLSEYCSGTFNNFTSLKSRDQGQFKYTLLS